ncbi:MAG: SAM domain-containing protein, partial [Microbacteriaceae bacterium]|nr:SAM domain-containing protein [Microbacteriaceae bacterium]
TTSDVLEWLEAKGFSDLSSIFEENMITGPDLQDLKESDLREELTIEDESLYQPLLAAIAALTEYE